MSSIATRCTVISCLVVILLSSLFFTLRYLQKSSATNREWEQSHWLPECVIPSHYSLLFHPDLETKTFYGQNNITLNITEKRKNIVVHSSELNISRTELLNDKNEKVTLEEKFYYPDNQFWVIIPQKELNEGHYTLILEFRGNLTGKVGFYRSMYVAADGTKKRFATTKFEPTYARKAFPCFDEPSFKATFTIQLVKPSGGNYTALSNMNYLNEVPDSPHPGLTTVKFAKSVLMSTYLVCFIICDFDHLQPVQSKFGFPVTLYARPAVIQDMQYCLNLSVKTIDFYIQYFNITYPLPKLDLLAVPDFVTVTMERWGLITFRETSVLYNESTSSSSHKKHLIMAVSHELAHMWFGNLVTMGWWDDLWHIEGFAKYMQYKGADYLQPKWDMDTQMVTDDVLRVMPLDAKLSSHPIMQNDTDQITEIFDTISHSKGASVLRMLENLMGSSDFQKGISNYLKTFSYKNSETKDLWNVLEDYSNGINITKVMGSWTMQEGYPLILAEKKDDNIILTQKRFLPIINTTFNENESDYHYKWDIPVVYVLSTNCSEICTTWLYSDQQSVTVKLPSGTEWFKINHQQYGYYRVRYTENEWQNLINMLHQNPNVITAADRANLLDDAFSLAKGAYIPYKIALDLIKYLPNEVHFSPWVVASQKAQYLQDILSSTPVYLKFRKFIHKLIGPVITDTLWNISSEDSYVERRTKIVKLELACTMQFPACIEKAQEKFNNWLMKNGSKPEPEFRVLIYNAGMSCGSETEWDRLWHVYMKENEPYERMKLRIALAAVRKPWLLSRLINQAKDENNLKSQDFLSLLIAISDNPVGGPIVWDFIRNQWSYLVKRFAFNSRTLGQVLPKITIDYGSQTKLNEMKSFLDSNPETSEGAQGQKMALERIENNIKWLKIHIPELLLIL